MNTKQKGNVAEFFVRMYLRLKGYHILHKNFVTGRGFGCGEVDIIAFKKNTLVFVEVKRRKNIKAALYAIKPIQQKRLLNAAKSFIKRYPKYQKCDIRFDAVLVRLPFCFQHIQNAWTA